MKMPNTILFHARSMRPAGLAASMVLIAACGGSNDNLPPPPPPPPPAPAIASAPTETPPATAAPDASAAPQAPPVTLTQGEASPDPSAPTPSAKIQSPSKDQVIAATAANDFPVKIDIKNWKVAPGDAHVHVILDGKPYKPIFDAKAPIKLSDLTGGDPLSEGQHILVAFPSRANHESVKTANALSMVEFWVGKKGDKTQDSTKPILIYSRPKGEYKGDMASRVLVDFQLVNDKLAADKDHVHIAVAGPGIDGEKTADATSFGAPFYLDNLQNGTYTVKLDLLGADGKPLPGPWNSNSRTFTVAR